MSYVKIGVAGPVGSGAAEVAGGAGTGGLAQVLAVAAAGGLLLTLTLGAAGALGRAVALGLGAAGAAPATAGLAALGPTLGAFARLGRGAGQGRQMRDLAARVDHRQAACDIEAAHVDTGGEQPPGDEQRRVGAPGQHEGAVPGADRGSAHHAAGRLRCAAAARVDAEDPGTDLCRCCYSGVDSG